MNTDVTTTDAADRDRLHPPVELEFDTDRGSMIDGLLSVPRRYAVAFAVRCARRVAPQLLESKDQEAIEWLEAVDSALGVFTRWTHGDTISRFRLERARGDCHLVRDMDVFVASAAASVADALFFTTSLIAADAPAQLAVVAGGAVADAAANATDASAETVRSAQADRNHLLWVSTPKGWHDDRPVPADFFGPLWVGEEPAWSREGWAKLKAYREEKTSRKPPPEEPGTTLEQLEGWFAELEKLRAERLPYPTEEERLADTNWLHQQMNARAMGGYLGRFVGVLNKEVVGTDTDATRLELALAYKYPAVNPDRFVIFHIG